MVLLLLLLPVLHILLGLLALLSTGTPARARLWFSSSFVRYNVDSISSCVDLHISKYVYEEQNFYEG
jgi:hypothetical protein